MIRVATSNDATAITRLVNTAFEVENFFKIGDRTDTNEILELMNTGEFLLFQDSWGIAGCLYLKTNDTHAYFGMLSIHPARQGQGLGRTLIEAAETRSREKGCRHMDIHIVNLREELFPFYRKFGYVQQGTLPFPTPERASRDCHFVVMRKPLGGQTP